MLVMKKSNFAAPKLPPEPCCQGKFVKTDMQHLEKFSENCTVFWHYVETAVIFGHN